MTQRIFTILSEILLEKKAIIIKVAVLLLLLVGIAVVVWQVIESKKFQGLTEKELILYKGKPSGVFELGQTAKLGSLEITAYDVKEGSYAKSKPSEKVTVLVSPPVFLRIGKLAIDYLTTIITLLILILAIILAILWAWREIKKKREKIQKETLEAERALFQAFKALKEEVEEQVAKLDGKPDLSGREKKIAEELKKALEISEKFIGKEIKDIEKEISK